MVIFLMMECRFLTWVNSLQNSTCYLSKIDNKNVDKIIDNQILAYRITSKGIYLISFTDWVFVVGWYAFTLVAASSLVPTWSFISRLDGYFLKNYAN